MSYEKRLQIEALPAEKGWHKWQAVVGYGTELVERKEASPVAKRIWVARPTGPLQIEATRYERWRFAQNGKPVDVRVFCYTVWHDNYNYTDYSPRAKQLGNLCAETREELCKAVQELLMAELVPLRKTVAEKEEYFAAFLI